MKKMLVLAASGAGIAALLEGVGRPVWGIDPGDELVETAVARAVARR